ncbi:MAG: hypothetical protein J6J31_03520 [Thermoguttaceae bacterium]|nr:hypothetical protein [Thermoguttaceae bacterium]
MRSRSVLIFASFFVFALISISVQAQTAGETPAAQSAPTVQAETPAPAPAPAPVEKTDAAAPAPAPAAKPAPESAPTPTALPAPEVPAAESAAGPVRRPIVRRGMLPLGYRDFVTNDQREQIYEIQKKYRPRMEELEKEMAALRAEMMQEIQTVLTPEQRQKIEARENEIRARRGLRNQGK